jgi:hypothetical protein
VAITDLAGLVAAVLQLHPEAAAVEGPDGADRPPELHRQLESPRVLGEIAGDVVAAGIRVGIAGKRQPRQAVVAHGREEPQGVPARPPRRRRRLGGIEDDEAPALPREEVAQGQPGLAATDDEDVEPRRHAALGGGTEAVMAARPYRAAPRAGTALRDRPHGSGA